MKYISIILMSLFLVGNVSADARMIKKLDLKTNEIGAYVYCIDGYKWVYTADILGGTLTSTLNQMMEEKENHSVPVKCME